MGSSDWPLDSEPNDCSMLKHIDSESYGREEVQVCSDSESEKEKRRKRQSDDAAC